MFFSKYFKSFDNFGIYDCLLSICAILTIYVVRYYLKYFNRVNPLPGPFPLPFVGNLPQYLWHGGNIKKFIKYYHNKYGDIFEFYIGIRTIVLNRAEFIEKILKPTKSMGKPHNKGFEELGIEKGIIFNNNHESWKYNRHFFTQAILTPKFTQEAINLTNELFNELENYWNKLYLKEEIIRENKNEFDFSIWFNQFTNDMIVALITGERSYTMAGYFNTQSDVKAAHPPAIIDDSVKIVHGIRKYLLGLSLFNYVSPFLRHYVPFFKNKSDDLIQNMGFIKQRLDAVIKKRRQEIENTPLDKPLPHDMLTSVITANTSRDVNNTKGNGMRPMTDIEIGAIMLDGFAGGTDTTANMITYITYYLSHNPDVKKKMLEEIDRIFQGDKTRPINENDFHNLKYCEAIIKEVARVFSVVVSLIRCNEKSEEVAGYEWPAGTKFHINIDAIHHQDDWKEPEKFNPDRWLDEGFESKKSSFIMFGGGLRICPGRKLAMIELVCLMALLFRKYEIDLVDMKSPLKTKSSIIEACTELLVKIKPRN